MNDLTIAGSQSTPDIRADWQQGTLSMKGDSYPENSFELFGPLMQWVQTYLIEAKRPFTVDLNLLYLNTSSIKVMMDIFELMEDAHRRGQPVMVNWFYDRRNERMAELAEEFREDCTFPFNIVEQAE